MIPIVSAALIVTSLVLITNVECFDVSDLIQNYYKCKNIKYSVEDSFYQSLGMNEMSLDQAMAFLSKIYSDTQNNCQTDFCKCIRGFIDQPVKYSVLFRNQSNLDGLKSILADFNNKYNGKNFMETSKNFLKMANIVDKFPTIRKFLIKFDFTPKKLNYYNKLPTCDQGLKKSNVKEQSKIVKNV